MSYVGTDLFNFGIKKLKKNGFYECGNPVLAEELYDYLKEDYPSLFKFESNGMIYVEIITKNRMNDLIERHNILSAEANEIHDILSYLSKN